MHSCKLYSFYGIDVAPCGNSRQAPAQQPALMRSGSVESCGTSSSVGSFEITSSAFDAMVQQDGRQELDWVDNELARLLMVDVVEEPPCISSSVDVSLHSSVVIEDVTDEVLVPSSIVAFPDSRQASVEAAMAMHAIDDQTRRSHAPVVSAAVVHFNRSLPKSCRPDRKTKAGAPKAKAKGKAKGKTSTTSTSATTSSPTTKSSSTTTSSTETDCPIRCTDTWNTFRSRRFKDAVKLGNAQGLSLEAHKAFRVQAYSKARDHWHEFSGKRQCTS